MTDPLDPPSSLASRLFDAERARPDVAADQAARILARVGATASVAVIGLGTAAAAVHVSKAAKLGLGAKTLPWIALAFAAGGGTGAVLHSTLAPPRTVLVAPPPAPAPAVSHEAAPVVALTAAPEPSAPPRPVPGAPLPSLGPDSSLAAERALVDRARTALTRGQPASALEALDAHAKQYPNGRLVEEREALAIQSLAALHRQPEAERRAKAFRRAHPQSVFLPAIDLAAPPAEAEDAGR